MYATNRCFGCTESLSRSFRRRIVLGRFHFSHNKTNNRLYLSKKISFIDGSTTGFESTTTLRLWRAAFVLKLCSSDFIVQNAVKMFNQARGVLGKKLFDNIMQMTFYGHFCIGKDPNKIIQTSAKLLREGIRPMLLVPIEDEAKTGNVWHCNVNYQESGHYSLHHVLAIMRKVLVKQNNSSATSGKEPTSKKRKIDTKRDVSSWLDANKRLILDCLEINSKIGVKNSLKLTQVRLSAIIPASVLEKLTWELHKVRQKSLKSKEEVASLMLQYLASIVENHKNNAEIEHLTDRELTDLRSGVTRFTEICKRSRDIRVSIFVDAEYTTINPAIRAITYYMMTMFNRKKPVVQHTYQAYLKETAEEVIEGLDFCCLHKIHFGAKIVRGAYMIGERQLAKMKNIESPVCDSKEATDDSFNATIVHILEAISKEKKICVTVATHNEHSINVALLKLHELKIPASSEMVTFAQIYGLSDHISNWLAKNGYVVYKSTPIGAVEDTLPYLSRRAQENNSVMDVRMDKKLVWKELRKRSWFKSIRKDTN